MSAVAVATRVASSAGGQILRAATRFVAVRPAAKPLHPDGGLVSATLIRFGSERTGTRSGASWLDVPGEDEVLVRRSRAVGLPPPVPDVFGLAVRVPVGGDEHGDLLLASTGLGRLTRFTLTAARSPFGRPLTTLLPYRAPAGPVLLSAVARDELTVLLSWAVGTGSWHHFGVLRLHGEPLGKPDPLLSFDPVLNPLPGLATYDWVRRLREPAYTTARRSRAS